MRRRLLSHIAEDSKAGLRSVRRHWSEARERHHPVGSTTDLPESPDDARKRRTVGFMIATAIRVVFLALFLVLDSWWVLIALAGSLLAGLFSFAIAGSPRRPRTVVESPHSDTLVLR